MEIKVGEYVRTENGEIHKVEDIEDLRIHIETEKIMFRSWVEDYYGAHKEDRFIVKHSNNIIDLIECGDIITHYDEDCLFKEEVWRTYKEKNKVYTIDGTEVNIKDIKSILTKEQFSSLEYIT